MKGDIHMNLNILFVLYIFFQTNTTNKTKQIIKKGKKVCQIFHLDAICNSYITFLILYI